MSNRPHGPRLDYVCVDDAVISHFDRRIDRSLEERLRKEKVVMQYCGWNFNGEVWFTPDTGLFHCRVSVCGILRETVSRRSLEEIVWYVSDEYGPE